MTRMVHFLNQFFAGVGGEEKAQMAPEIRKGALGPGKPLQLHLGDTPTIEATVLCGDNFFAEHGEEANARILALLKEFRPQLLLAGPAFDSGRYGFACAEVCHAVSTSLSIPCVTAMHPENPGVDAVRSYKDLRTYVIPTAETVAGMPEALRKMADFAKRLAAGEAIGPALEAGYLPRGIRKDEVADKTAAERALDMLLAKIAGKPFLTEVPWLKWAPVSPAKPLADLRKAVIAVATTSGLVPWGNPDQFWARRNTKWGKYALTGHESMEKGKWEAVHSGYNTAIVGENPNYAVPLDAVRELEASGAFGALYPYYYSTTGGQGAPQVMEKIAREMSQDMKSGGVDGVLLVAT
ncbi:MAG: glycine/betaine/sarcosine/D-proline family reductase selenoprotein B [Deltaproteobacteria bacterium]|nr:glycine/betaine/sarcosine/D-proline family reductase selenoprotein B [Deltaproteobacteria bacterium]